MYLCIYVCMSIMWKLFSYIYFFFYGENLRIYRSFFSKGMLMYVLYVWRLLPQASSTESEYGDLLGGVSFAQRKKLQAAKESQTVAQVRFEKTHLNCLYVYEL